MGACRSIVRYLVIGAMFLPAIALAECAEWWVCPYASPDGDSNTRYVSIDDLRLPFEWNEIEVSGNRAIVCLSRPMPDGDTFGCREISCEQLRDMLTRVPGRRFDPRAIRKRIQDSCLPYNYIRGRNP